MNTEVSIWTVVAIGVYHLIALYLNDRRHKKKLDHVSGLSAKILDHNSRLIEEKRILVEEPGSTDARVIAEWHRLRKQEEKMIRAASPTEPETTANGILSQIKSDDRDPMIKFWRKYKDELDRSKK